MSPSTSEALEFDAAQCPFPEWSLVHVTGRHRERYLHSQLTSDVRSLPEGETQLSALLDTSGRLQSFFFLNKSAAAVRLLIPSEILDKTIARLGAHVIADDVDIRPVETGGMRLLLGPAVAEFLSRPHADHCMPITGFGAQAAVDWSGAELRIPMISGDEFESRRVLSGVPRWGQEVRVGQLVNETTLVDSAVSVTKGCFLGQETVAKVASRRGAAYSAMVLVLDAEIEDPAELVGERFSALDRGKAGTVLSCAVWRDATYLLVSLWRDFRVAGRSLVARFPDGTELASTVRPLPVVETPSKRQQADDLYHRAVKLFSEDHEEAALTLLKRVVAVCPGYGDAYESLGVIFGRQGQFDEAIHWMDRLLDVDPESVMAHTNKSVYFNQLGRNDEAEEEARLAAAKNLERDRRKQDQQALTQDNTDAEADERRRREEMFRQVLEIDPSDTLANFGLGQLKLESGRFEDAIGRLEAALASDADYSAAYLALGRAFEGSGDEDRAVQTYTTGVDVAARRGDMKTANAMQERLAELEKAKGESHTRPTHRS